VVTSLTLDVLPDFQVRQYVYDTLPRTQIDAHLGEIMADGYSVSLFTDWTGVDVNHVWLKRLEPMSGDWFGAHPADGPRHPVPGMPATNSTEQGGVPGPWHLRLPHFRMEFTPSAGQELQSEYHIARENGLAAFDAVSRIRERVAPVLQVSEIRTIAADELWMSPNYRRDTLALHFTWIADTDAVLPVVADVEAALAPFDPRPHWGKVFTTNPATLRTQYERFADFQSLVRRYDPAGVFRNEWQDAILGTRP
jgi:xylitol oxidase